MIMTASLSLRHAESSRRYGSPFKDALKPNLVQTIENVPAIIHGGPLPILPMVATASWLPKLL
jgi:hypothetical protein